MSAPRWLDILGRTLKDNSPAILSGVAIAGVIGTAVLAVKATPKAMEVLAQAKDDKEYKRASEAQESIMVEGEPLTIKEAVLATWHLYIPAGLSGIATIACIIGANAIGARRTAAVAAAYTLVDSSFREYKDKVLEEIGASKARKVDDEIQKDRLDRNPPTQVIFTGLGEQLCYDSLTGRYFKSDIEAIRKAQNEVNATVLRDMYAPHNDFYTLLGLGSTVVGEELGWNIDNLMELVFTSHLSECNQPALAIGYAKLPVRDYHKI
jgi:hypothetical protein